MSILLVELIFSSEAESASVAVTPMGLHVILQVISQTTQGLEKRLGLLRAAVRPVACLFWTTAGQFARAGLLFPRVLIISV